MTCQDARHWLSDLIDESLEADRRAEVDTHLATCVDCRVELERLRATVGALRGLDRPRAPAGFVAGVVRRVHPEPWYRRLSAWLFLPLSVKLPAEVAALVVIAGLAVLVWQRTPELRDAVHSPPPPSAPPTAAVDPVARGPLQNAPDPRSAISRRAQAPREVLESRARSPKPVEPEPPAVPAESVASVPPAPEAKAVPGAKATPEAKAEREAREEPPPRPLALPPSPATQADRGDTRARSAAQAVHRTLAPTTPPPDLAGRLLVSDREAAVVAVGELLARLGGRETGRHRDEPDTVMDVQIPAARYDDFVRGLEGLGAWTASGRPNVLPLHPPQIRLTIRLSG